mmetsp:Transcript_135276/g.306025  ORF Transcript_135276/g.306025 Transcript_135276/m.306025 type:complete len:221 (+) Transcript_135276:2097-2759(+)
MCTTTLRLRRAPETLAPHPSAIRYRRKPPWSVHLPPDRYIETVSRRSGDPRPRRRPGTRTGRRPRRCTRCSATRAPRHAARWCRTTRTHTRPTHKWPTARRDCRSRWRSPCPSAAAVWPPWSRSGMQRLTLSCRGQQQLSVHRWKNAAFSLRGLETREASETHPTARGKNGACPGNRLRAGTQMDEGRRSEGGPRGRWNRPRKCWQQNSIFSLCSPLHNK